jgi:ChrB, C-terminal domain
MKAPPWSSAPQGDHQWSLTGDKDLTPESRGLDAIAGGFQQMEIKDHEKLDREFPVYDALYVYCGGALPIPKPSVNG